MNYSLQVFEYCVSDIEHSYHRQYDLHMTFDHLSVCMPGSDETKAGAF